KTAIERMIAMEDVSHLLNDLNPAQREAVAAKPQHLLVLAGAGSGKTRVLVLSIAWLVGTGQCSPYGILAVTFTNNRAAEMRRRKCASILANCCKPQHKVYGWALSMVLPTVCCAGTGNRQSSMRLLKLSIAMTNSVLLNASWLSTNLMKNVGRHAKCSGTSI